MKKNSLSMIKMMVGGIVSILISNLFGLSYGITAGVVSILSLEQTKKKSFNVAFKRMVIALLGLGVSSVLYELFDYHVLSLFMSMIIVIIVGFSFHLKEGIVVAIVLLSHAFVEIDVSYSLNATYILVIGVGVALMLNLFMPNNERKIKDSIHLIDDLIKEAIGKLISRSRIDFVGIELVIDEVRKDLLDDIENKLIATDDNRTTYIQMRLSQIEYLRTIERLLLGVSTKSTSDLVIYEFLEDLKKNIGLTNNASPLLVKLKEIENVFKITELPKDRNEFESRAHLYMVLLELKSFLNQKIFYHQAHPNV